MWVVMEILSEVSLVKALVSQRAVAAGIPDGVGAGARRGNAANDNRTAVEGRR
jgi:hypothetical protein